METTRFGACDKILRVARTLADLNGEDRINANPISETVQYRGIDRQLFWTKRPCVDVPDLSA